MRRYVMIIIALMMTLSSLYAQGYLQDIVYMKDGTIIRGTILERIPFETLKIRTADGNELILNINDVTKTQKELPPDLQTELPSEKSPELAFFLSIIPSLGQYYNGQYVKGMIMTSIHICGVVMVRSNEDAENNDLESLGEVIVAGNWLWSLIDAPISATKINRERENFLYGHLLQFEVGNYALGVDLTNSRKTYRATVTIHF